jgi:hypothetical protein
MGFP